MSAPEFIAIADQVAAHLQAEISRGRWSGDLPGRNQLAAELGINPKTVEAALRLLETAGVVIGQGAGKRRRVASGQAGTPRRLRIGWLFDERETGHQPDYLVALQHLLNEDGHTVVHAPKTMADLKFDVGRIAELVRSTQAEAWLIAAGSRPVLEWFAAQPTPAFALFGQRAGLKLPAVGPDKPPAMATATRHLLDLGHRRIALLVRRVRRVPAPGPPEQAFLDELLAGGVKPGRFNLPDWEDSVDGLNRLLESMFQVTPPTALIVDEAAYYVAVLQFLARRGVRVPGQVSLICTDDDLAFAYCEPPVSRIVWDSRPIVRRIREWAGNVSRHRPDFRQSLTPAEFVPGGTIAPAVRRS